MADNTERLDFISVCKIVLYPETKAEEFEKLMKEEIFHILGADMTFRDGSSVGDNKLYAMTGAGDYREYLWTTGYFRSFMRSSEGPNPEAAKLHSGQLAERAQEEIKKLGELTLLGLLSIPEET